MAIFGVLGQPSEVVTAVPPGFGIDVRREQSQTHHFVWSTK
jgi:hypothetical protein